MKFTDVCQQLGIPFKTHGEHHHVTAGFVGIDCPHCSPGSGKFRMGYSLSGGFLTCWTCGYHRLGDTLVALAGAKAWGLARSIQREFSPREFKPRGEVKLPPGVGDLREPHRTYLESRGFDADEVCRVWGVRGIGLSSKLAWRVFIPILDDEGALVSWTTRAIWETKRRYVSASPAEEAVPHKSLLYGELHCLNSVIVCEGPLDVWKVGPGAVCTFGVVPTKSQVARIAKYPLRVVCYDSSPEAQKGAESLCSQLEVLPGRTLNVVLDAKDPGEAGEEELAKLRKLVLEVGYENQR